jgi:glutathione S-transferase
VRPGLAGADAVMADASLHSDCAPYAQAIMAMPAMREWFNAAKAEPDEVAELDVEF